MMYVNNAHNVLFCRTSTRVYSRVTVFPMLRLVPLDNFETSIKMLFFQSQCHMIQSILNLNEKYIAMHKLVHCLFLWFDSYFLVTRVKRNSFIIPFGLIRI